MQAPELTFFSGELPWRDNRTGASSVPVTIPPGIYRVVWAFSPRLRKHTYRLLDVPARDGILIHASNLMGDPAFGYHAQLLGCISLGEKLGWMDKQKALLLSRPAVRRFEEVMKREPFELEVRNV